MKLADTTGAAGPVDPFKTEYNQQKSKFHIAEKVNLQKTWQPNDKIGDPRIRRNWLPEARWSQTEKALRCEGFDRDYRTIEKIHERATIEEKLDMEREKMMEDVVIRQAPRSLQ